jgi:hypothetical protein
MKECQVKPRIIVMYVVTSAMCSLYAMGQAAVSDRPYLKATDSALPALSSQIDIKDACSSSDPKNQPPVSVRWHFRKESEVQTSWIRAHILLTGSTSESWRIEVRDGGGSLRQTLSVADFDDGGLWTNEIPSGAFSIDLIADSHVPIVVCVNKVSVNSSQAILSSKAITSADGKDRRVPLVSVDPYYAFRKPIAIIWFLQPDGTKTNCSGFAVTNSDVITNYHCLSNSKQLRYVEVRFAYEVGVTDWLSRRVTKFAVPPNRELDYSVLVLDQPLPPEYVGALSTKVQTKGVGLILFQHPDGLPKMIVSSGCSVKDESSADTIVVGSDYSHLCDSSGGSSGSPVMDLQGKIVGIHHLEQYDEHSSTYYNMAVKIPVLLIDLGQSQAGRDLLARVTVSP